MGKAEQRINWTFLWNYWIQGGCIHLHENKSQKKMILPRSGA